MRSTLGRRPVAAVVLLPAALVLAGCTPFSPQPSPSPSTSSTRDGAPDVRAGESTSPGITRIEVGTGPFCLVRQDDGIWVMNHRDTTIQRIDPKTDAPDEPIDAGGFDYMIGAGKKLLLAVQGGPDVAVFDPRTGKLRRVPLPEFVAGLAFDARSNTAWVGAKDNGSLTHVDVDSGRALERLTIEGLSDADALVPTSSNDMWVVTFDGEVLHVDLAKRRVVARVQPFKLPAEVTLAWAGGFLWATSLEQPTLVRIDPHTHQIDLRRDLGTGGTHFPGVSGAPDGTLWLARAPGRIEKLDPRTGRTVNSYAFPLKKDVDPADYFRTGSTTGFGSVWTATFDDFQSDHAVIRLPAN